MSNDGPAKADAPALEPTRISIAMLLIVGSLTAFGPLSIDLYLPAFPKISHDLHAPASAVQLSLTGTLIGLALGQVIVGPLSDRFGRRIPLFIGLIVYVVASLLCALTTNIPTLIPFRVLQGLGGSAGMVTAFAVVRDRYSGVTAARFFATVTMVTATSPIIAPIVGGGLLAVGSWRLIFVALAAIGALLLLSAVRNLPETLPPEKRTSGGVGHMARSLAKVATDRRFLVNALAGSFGIAAVFAYIAGSSFVLQDVYGLSPQMFSLAFSVNALGVILGSYLSARLVQRYGVAQLLSVGLFGLFAGSAGFLLVVLSHTKSVGWLLICMFTVLLSTGVLGPNATALAMEDFPHAAGSASAALGVMRFAFGAAVAPLVGLGGSGTAMPLAVVMASCATAALLVRVVFRPHRDQRPEPEPEATFVAGSAVEPST
jgi:DHA1 family bicyclomycin/chloramphenicol resistance-like MFS transporter